MEILSGDISAIIESEPREAQGHVILAEDPRERRKIAMDLVDRDFGIVYLPNEEFLDFPLKPLLHFGFQIVCERVPDRCSDVPIDPNAGLMWEIPRNNSDRAQFVTILGAPNVGKSTLAKSYGKLIIAEDRPLLSMKWPHYTGYLGDVINDLLRNDEYRVELGPVATDPYLLQIATSANRIAEVPALVTVSLAFGRSGTILFEDSHWTGIIHGIVQECIRGVDRAESEAFFLRLNRHMFEADHTCILTGKRFLQAVEGGHLTEDSNWDLQDRLHLHYAAQKGWVVISNYDHELDSPKLPHEIAMEMKRRIADRTW